MLTRQKWPFELHLPKLTLFQSEAVRLLQTTEDKSIGSLVPAFN